MDDRVLPPHAGHAATARRCRAVRQVTGNAGARSPRAAIRHPRLDLVGVHVHDPHKVGQDAGELADTVAVGIVATGAGIRTILDPPQVAAGLG